ncbi:MAG: SPOR domain-containing protein [Flavobacteriales bacterium]
MKDEDVKKLLNENKKVIIPGLGMLMLSEYSGKHTIMFNPYLQINDGILSKYLIDEYKISQEEALTHIEDYVAEIKTKTNNGSVTIEGIGELSSKGDGAMSFVQHEDKADPSKSLTNDDITEKTEGLFALEKIKEVEIKTEEQETYSAKSKDEIIVGQKKESISLKFEIHQPTETKSEEKETKHIGQQTDKIEDNEQEKADIEALKKGTQKLAKEPKIRNKKRLILVIFLLVVLGGGATLVYLNLEDVKQWISEMTGAATDDPENELNVAEHQQIANTEEDSNAPEEEYIVEEQEKNEPPTEEDAKQEEQKVAKSSGATGQYHVIAGSFSIEENAINLVVQLTQKGYNAQLLGKFGGLYQVSAGASADKQSANDIARKLKDSESMDSWVRLW